MSDSRDFGSRDRAPTIVTPVQGQSSSVEGIPRSPAPSPKSIRSSVGRRRTHSVSSNLSVPNSNENVRNRKPSRTNTVTTYHEPMHLPVGVEFGPGTEPGVDTSAEDDKIPSNLTNLKNACEINIIDFSDSNVTGLKVDNEGLADALAKPRTEDLPCRWISVNGLSWDVIKVLGRKYKLHRLAIEDLMHTHTRTKVDWYADHAFIVLTLQKLVLLHQHKGSGEKCSCSNSTSDDDSEEVDEKFETYNDRHHHKRRWWSWLKRGVKPHKQDVLPRYLDRNQDGKIDEFINAHSGLTQDSPIKPIRTLHRYESAQIPEHTAWMERHSALASEDMVVSVEQVALFLMSDNTVISFFEHSAEDVENPILDRLDSKETMLRRSCDASLLIQAIIDAIVDLAGPVKDAYNTARKELQIDAMTNPNIKTSRALHIFGEEVDMLQNLFKPIVHLVNSLRDHNSEPQPLPQEDSIPENNTPAPKMSRRMETGGLPHAQMQRKMSDFRKIALMQSGSATSVTITPLAHTYFGDVLDHCITMISALEQMDASANNISTLIFNTVGARTNNFMMILAVVTVFFAPLTFVSGYFGMNFADGAGLSHPFAFFWVVATPSLVGFMLLVFGVMLWDNIKDFLARRGVKANRSLRKAAAGRRRREGSRAD